jgi:histidine triad (HIT) family protein
MKKVSDFYCDEVFSGKTKVKIVRETKNILAFYHTKQYYPAHIIVTPKEHV